jgi:hypothetical protein
MIEVDINGMATKFAPVEISAMILQKMKATAELSWVRPSRTLLLLFRPISMMLNVKLPRMPENLWYADATHYQQTNSSRYCRSTNSCQKLN